ncbi:hypothetical protein LAWI1_G005263 [Lachnellula willkommii]|uniref:Uncharacterized protein n=1 Tax=Lachnellula willkommii TaxID=215461 RepID=A0A559M842_9HELO|nr:hypothetical protein LAWI1_G005263 [Lachnellula willkommii]
MASPFKITGMYLASNFKYAPHQVRDFHQSRPNKPGPPRLLPQWLQAYDKGLDSYKELDNNNKMDKESKDNFIETLLRV